MARLTADQQAYLKNLSPRAKACKALRRHPFPILVPGEPIPAGIRIVAVSGGIDVEYQCPNCGRIKIEAAGPRGLLGVSDTAPTYRGGDGGKEDYLAPKGLGLLAPDYRASYYSDLAATVRKAAKQR
jgi:hypothetical protein